ncbi:acetoacetyl-CoA synthetase [Alloalcanivorax xenomutans]|uniref:acetoacetate--CoA ligase n=1 Tax=Alloalcanivorax xenomutans TaxID=1094342 RepID=UPI000BD4D6C1|nr:acetoacetate--CoA ligase [Alloalcanivorax xenomutans]SOC14288.1 acetoacetyl-CoA synthetase [Alloalcanivorax xenomutans]
MTTLDQQPLWQPDQQRLQHSALNRFWQQARALSGLPLPDYRALHQWSVNEPEAFWNLVWDFSALQGEKGAEVLERAERFRDHRWFPQARLNAAENLLPRHDDHTALISVDEAGQRHQISYSELRVAAGQVAAQLHDAGVRPGDRVAGYMPNRIETIIAALGAAWIGAIWSSCSPDFGVQGVLDRFGQIEPKVLFACDGYQYNGKWIALGERLQTLREQLKPELLVVIPGRGKASNVHAALPWSEWLDAAGPAPAFAALPFDHPLYILYSSGTTGAPKCIVHGAGGTLIQHAKEHRLHGDLGADDVLFYFTTCGWMMWNWLVGGLQSGATLVLYDGNPAYPDASRLFDLIDTEGVTHFGTSAKFVQAVEKAGIEPIKSHSLETLRVLYSTGSPLLHESYDFLYQKVKPDLLVSSISGGTDIISTFALGNPMLPVHRGELQCLGLGMDVAVFDDDGQAVSGEKGELVCRTPFPCCPVAFWNDPDGQRFQDAYFERFASLGMDIWAHGDYAETVAHEGHDGLIIHGRSDAVLNPGGVRIGTAEIYRQVETLPQIREAVVIGQQWQGDVRVVLFVVMAGDAVLDDDLKQTLRQTIRDGASPRHVPAVILEVPEIPRTVSGKIVELAVRDIVHGREVRNRNALANPDALAHFANRPELAE